MVLEAQGEPQVAQERAKVGPRRSSWSRDGSRMAQESAKMEPRWPSRSQNGANMAPRCQRCVNMGRHCAYLEKASFSFRFFLVFEARREPQVAQEGAKVGPRRPSWSQDGPKMAQETILGHLGPSKHQNATTTTQQNNKITKQQNNRT